MTWLRYLLEANLYLSLFYLLYYLFLKQETLYIMNRVYLLSTCLLSFLIPLVQIGALKPAKTPLRATLVLPVSPRFPLIVNSSAPVPPNFGLQSALLYAYLLGAGILTIILFIKLAKLLSLARKQKEEVTAAYKLIYLEHSNTAFSFFSYLFIGADAIGKQTIIRHELVHIKQKHSADIFLLELIKIICWFNPFVYLLQNSLKEIHEFTADEQTAAAEADSLTYASFLVNNAYGIGGSSITHSFFNYNLLKKRIIMLHQQRSGNLARLKYLLVIPLCAALLCASTLGFSKTYGIFNLMPGKITPKNMLSGTRALPGDSNATFKRTYTQKGYKFQEDGYLINNKVNFRVIITDKGIEKSYFRNSASPAELKMLRDKYGYEFPTVTIFYPKLPPPPPVPPASKAIDKRPPPPPPAPPVGLNQDKLKHPAEPIANVVQENNGTTVDGKDFSIFTEHLNATPLIFVNGIKYNLKEKLKVGQTIYFNHSDSSIAYDAIGAIKTGRWKGEDLSNGVIEVFGNPSIVIKQSDNPNNN